MQTKLKSKVIDLKWITDCIKVGKLLDTEFYLVFGFDPEFINNHNNINNLINNSSSEKEEEEEEENSAGSKSKKKKNESRDKKKLKLESEKKPREYVKGNFTKKNNSKNSQSEF